MAAFERYPRIASGVLVVGMCTAMAVFTFPSNRWIAGGLVAFAVLRGLTLYRDIQRRRTPPVPDDGPVWPQERPVTSDPDEPKAD